MALVNFEWYWSASISHPTDHMTTTLNPRHISALNEQAVNNNSWLRLEFENTNGTNSSSTLDPNTIALSTIEILASMYFPLLAYLLPLIIVLSIVNNSLVLYVLLLSKRYKEHTSKNVSLQIKIAATLT